MGGLRLLDCRSQPSRGDSPLSTCEFPPFNPSLARFWAPQVRLLGADDARLSND